MQQTKFPESKVKAPMELIKDHLELSSLEWKFEKQEGGRRLLIFGISAILLSCSFIYFQIAIISWFLKMGFNWSTIGLLFGFIFLVWGISVGWFFGKRPEGLGEPFQGSRVELIRSLNWIQKLFF